MELLGRITLEKLEAALDLLITIEPSSESLDPEKEYSDNVRLHQKGIERAELIIKEYAIQNQHQPLEKMQEVFYSLVNLEKYNTPVSRSVVSSSLSQGWNGIGSWLS